MEAEPKSLLQVRIGAGDKVRLRETLPPDFIECIRQGRRTCAPVEVAHRSTTLCSIAAIGMQVRRKLTWDGKREELMSQGNNRFIARDSGTRMTFDQVPWSTIGSVTKRAMGRKSEAV